MFRHLFRKTPPIFSILVRIRAFFQINISQFFRTHFQVFLRNTKPIFLPDSVRFIFFGITYSLPPIARCWAVVVMFIMYCIYFFISIRFLKIFYIFSRIIIFFSKLQYYFCQTLQSTPPAVNLCLKLLHIK